MRIESRREREKRLKAQKRSGIIGMVAAFAIIAILGVAVWNSKQSLEKKGADYQVKKEQLLEKIDEQQKRADSLAEYKKYIQTKKFVEEIAKDKFGLIYPDELLFQGK